MKNGIQKTVSRRNSSRKGKVRVTFKVENYIKQRLEEMAQAQGRSQCGLVGELLELGCEMRRAKA
jgi:predicted DNA-binding ribbon-helix-helix protein